MLSQNSTTMRNLQRIGQFDKVSRDNGQLGARFRVIIVLRLIGEAHYRGGTSAICCSTLAQNLIERPCPRQWVSDEIESARV